LAPFTGLFGTVLGVGVTHTQHPKGGPLFVGAHTSLGAHAGFWIQAPQAAAAQLGRMVGHGVHWLLQ
jgi:hypothetical protein